MNIVEILARLVAFPSVVGTSNAGIVDWIRTYLEGFGIHFTVLPGPEGDRSNLFATIMQTLGVEYGKEITTPIGRPMALCQGKPIERLLG